MISSISYNGDGSTRIFPVTFKINGEDYVRVYVDNVEVVDRTKYDIINNSIVFTSDDIPAVGTDNIKIYVATSSAELGDLGAPLTDITNVSNNLAEIVAVSTQVIPNLPEILLADNNATIATSQATIATTQAGEASASATSASNSATTATTKANEASASATSASNSATSASNNATTATTKANEASASATTATTKASEASASATSASTSANTATTKASEASASATTATTKANTATTKAAEASASATSASTSANNASASETNSALSEANALSYKNSASDSADTATTQAGIAATKAGEASTSASQALGYRNEALGYRNEVEASALSIDSANLVHKTGDETIAGVKTFTSSPIAPTPAPNDYGNRIATIEFVLNSSNSENAYQGSYGISWDYATDTYIRTGAKGYTAIQSMMRRCVLNADGTVNYYLHPDNSNFKEDGTPSVLTGADGNVMVEIPKHYVKVETVGNVDSFSISLTQEPGYVLDPSFMKWNGTEMVEVPYRYFRAYEGYVSNGKLLSVSGVTPTKSQTIATFRTQAMANGLGWHLTDWNLLNTVKRLCYIEFCDFIVTKYLGNGNDTGTDYGITTGQSNALGNRSSNSTHNDKYMSYRGIENMYADIGEFVDGININNYQAYVNQKWSTFASNVFTGDYIAKGPLIASGASNSLIKRCNVSVGGGFIPTVVGGSTATFYGDALWSNTGARVALYGGDADRGTSAGLGVLNVNDASSNSAVNVGAAVCR